MGEIIDQTVIGYEPFFDVRLLVFPEFAHAVPIHDEPKKLLETVAVELPNEHTDFYEKLAKKHGCYIQTGTFLERDDNWPGQVFNTTLLIGPEGILSKYRKINTWIPWEVHASPHDLPGYAEDPFPVVDTEIGRLGVAVCYDWIFPETIRELAFRGAEVLIRVSAYMDPWGTQQPMDWWTLVNRTRALENTAYVVAANQGAEMHHYPPFSWPGGPWPWTTTAASWPRPTPAPVKKWSSRRSISKHCETNASAAAATTRAPTSVPKSTSMRNGRGSSRRAVTASASSKPIKESPRRKNACPERASTMNRIPKFLLPIVVVLAVLAGGCQSDRDQPSREAIEKNNRGVALMGQYKNEQARQVFAELFRSHPDWLDVRVNEAIATLNRQEEGDERRALAIVGEVLEADPEHARARYVAGLMRYYLGENERALEHFQALREAVPDDPHVAYFTAQANAQLGNDARALELYERAIDLDNYLQSAYYGAALIHRQLGQADAAREKLAAYRRFENNPRAHLAEFRYTRMGPLAEAQAVDRETDGGPPPAPEGGLFGDVGTVGELPESAGPASLTTADINGSGRQDLFVADPVRNPGVPA